MHWQSATLLSSHKISRDVTSLVLKPEHWEKFLPGQHFDIRLTASNGYQAERAYSVMSAPEDEGVFEFGVQLLENGEVSPFLCSMPIGETIGIRGPIGGHFVLEDNQNSPLILIGGGSGCVPLLSMIRHLVNSNSKRPIKYLVSCKTEDDIINRGEVQEILKNHNNIKFLPTLTGTVSSNWSGHKGRIDDKFLKENLQTLLPEKPEIFVCGPIRFVEFVCDELLDLGFSPPSIKTERFG